MDAKANGGMPAMLRRDDAEAVAQALVDAYRAAKKKQKGKAKR